MAKRLGLKKSATIVQFALRDQTGTSNTFPMKSCLEDVLKEEHERESFRKAVHTLVKFQGFNIQNTKTDLKPGSTIGRIVKDLASLSGDSGTPDD